MSDISMVPVTRKEFYLAEITGMDVDAPAPVTRLETYLNDIINGTASQLAPVTRVETYLAKISGADVTIPAPVTRLELYLAKIAGMDVDVPDPVTREEHWLWMWANAGPAGTEVTVEGEAPITLTDAIRGAIRSLIQYGQCYQATTPALDAPVDIVCNNGMLKMVDDELPTGYKRLMGITFDGNFRYETGEALTGDDDVTLTIDNVASSGKNLFGSYNGSNDKNFSLYIYGNASTGSYFRYGDQLKRPKYGTGRRTITFGASGTSGFAEDSTVTPDEFTTPANTYIGMLPNSSSPAFAGDIIGSILVGTRLEWIPCENPNGVIGYYEKYKGAFLEPVGTGTPVSLGYDYTQAHLAVVGTPEVLTVSATGATPQTASVPNLFGVDNRKDWVDIISGEVHRTCGVLVLDGTEDWQMYPGYSYFFLSNIEPAGPIPTRAPQNYRPISTHFPHPASLAVPYLRTAGSKLEFYYSDEFSDIATWKAWLAAQYAAGTPVILVYKLNEDYSEQIAPQKLHVAEGSNTVSVVANVSPVNLECTYIAANA